MLNPAFKGFAGSLGSPSARGHCRDRRINLPAVHLCCQHRVGGMWGSSHSQWEHVGEMLALGSGYVIRGWRRMKAFPPLVCLGIDLCAGSQRAHKHLCHCSPCTGDPGTAGDIFHGLCPCSADLGGDATPGSHSPHRKRHSLGAQHQLATHCPKEMRFPPRCKQEPTRRRSWQPPPAQLCRHRDTRCPPGGSTQPAAGVAWAVVAGDSGSCGVLPAPPGHPHLLAPKGLHGRELSSGDSTVSTARMRRAKADRAH